LQVQHQSAVKSMKTVWPLATDSSSVSTEKGSQRIPPFETSVFAANAAPWIARGYGAAKSTSWTKAR
jgi:hypothetical protein